MTEPRETSVEELKQEAISALCHYDAHADCICIACKWVRKLADRLAAATLSTSGLKDLLADTQKDLAAETKAREESARDALYATKNWQGAVKERDIHQEARAVAEHDLREAEREVERLRATIEEIVGMEVLYEAGPLKRRLRDYLTKWVEDDDARAALRSGEKP